MFRKREWSGNPRARRATCVRCRRSHSLPLSVVSACIYHCYKRRKYRRAGRPQPPMFLRATMLSLILRTMPFRTCCYRPYRWPSSPTRARLGRLAPASFASGARPSYLMMLPPALCRRLQLFRTLSGKLKRTTRSRRKSRSTTVQTFWKDNANACVLRTGTVLSTIFCVWVPLRLLETRPVSSASCDKAFLSCRYQHTDGRRRKAIAATFAAAVTHRACFFSALSTSSPTSLLSSGDLPRVVLRPS